MTSTVSGGDYVVLFIFFSLVVGTLIRHISKETRIRIPYTVLVMLFGLAWGIVVFQAKWYGVVCPQQLFCTC